MADGNNSYKMIHLKDALKTPAAKYSKRECRKELKSLHGKLFELQNVFYANGSINPNAKFWLLSRYEKGHIAKLKY